MPTNESFTALLERIRRGDEAAATELVSRYEPAIRRSIRGMLTDARVRQLVDCYRQVTASAGDYQLDGAKRFAMLNLGGSGTTSCAFVVGV